jgi:hypothetical protein
MLAVLSHWTHAGTAILMTCVRAPQVRNLTSSMKVAVDFLSPHNMGLCLHMAREIRGDGQDDNTTAAEWYADPENWAEKQEKLQSEPILVHVAYAQLKQLGRA